MTCEHDTRFSGVFDLPKDCGGCLACYAEKLAKEVERLEGLLSQVWDFARDNNLSFRQRIVAVMTTIREKPVAKAKNNDS
jgi:hypothetical protein